MTKKLFIPIFLLALVLTGVATPIAPDFNGHWRGKFMDQYDLHYEFKVDGTTVTGKAYSMEGTVSEIRDGKLDGNKITFVLDIMGSPTAATAVLENETLTLSFNVQGFDVVASLKKSEN